MAYNCTLEVNVSVGGSTALGFSASLAASSPPVPFAAFGAALLGTDLLSLVPVPQSVRDELNSAFSFQSIAVSAQLAPPQLEASGQMFLFGMSVAAVVRVGRDSSNQMGLTVGAQLSTNSLSSLLPGVTALDFLPLGQLFVVLSSRQATITFPGVGSLAAPDAVVGCARV